MESSKNINFIVLAFVFLIIGSVLIGQVATNTTEKTTKLVITDESSDLEALGCIQVNADGGHVNETSECNITVTNYPSSWKVSDCPLTLVTVKNSTTDFTLDTDYYVFESQGIVQMLNTTDTQAGQANTTLVDYTYCGDDYLNSGWGRTVLDLVAGFFALALLGVSLWLFYGVFKNNGIIN